MAKKPPPQRLPVRRIDRMIPDELPPKTANAHRFGPETSLDARFYSAFSAKRSDDI
jgi:hypothetical protein